MKTWQIVASVFCLLTIAIISVVNVVVPTDSQDCSICGHIKCHAPCILNLATGKIGELELYMPHDTEVGELAEEQTGGTFGFISVAGLHGIRQTTPWVIELEVPMEGNKKRLSHYCDSCRKRLEDGEYFEVPSLKLPKGYIKGTVGAGDAFCAGVLYAAEMDMPMDTALRLGACAAAASLSEVSASDGVKTVEEVMKLYDLYI